MNTILNAKEVKKLILNVYLKLKTGDLTAEQATKEVNILNSLLKAVEVAEIEQRLQRIEQQLNIE
jgi:hypothetical protein